MTPFMGDEHSGFPAEGLLGGKNPGSGFHTLSRAIPPSSSVLKVTINGILPGFQGLETKGPENQNLEQGMVLGILHAVGLRLGEFQNRRMYASPCFGRKSQELRGAVRCG